MTFEIDPSYLQAPAQQGDVQRLRNELARSDERLRAMDRELQRVTVMVEKLYCLRYHEPPPRVKRSIRLDEDGDM